MLARHPPSSAMRLKFAVVVAATLTLGAIGRAAPAAAATPSPAPAEAAAGAEPGHWQPHSFVLHAMTFTSTYSCDGLADKLKLLLRLTGAASIPRWIRCVRAVSARRTSWRRRR